MKTSIDRLDNLAGGQGVARLLRGVAFALLLACVAGRAFVAEVPFRVNPLKTVVAAGAADGQGGAISDRTEVARITFAMLLLASAGLWLLAGAAGGRLDVKYPAIGLGVLAFVSLSAISAAMAADKRNAWDTWLEQAALLVAGFVAMQLCRSACCPVRDAGSQGYLSAGGGNPRADRVFPGQSAAAVGEHGRFPRQPWRENARPQIAVEKCSPADCSGRPLRATLAWRICSLRSLSCCWQAA